VRLALPWYIVLGSSLAWFGLVIGYCYALRSQLGRESHNGKRLPTKKKITLKLFSLNKLDQQTNPLNSSVSLNHKQGGNFQAKAKLSDTRTSKPLGSQASKRQAIPYKGRVMK
jgi:hypothetical protein